METLQMLECKKVSIPLCDIHTLCFGDPGILRNYLKPARRMKKYTQSSKIGNTRRKQQSKKLSESKEEESNQEFETESDEENIKKFETESDEENIQKFETESDEEKIKGSGLSEYEMMIEKNRQAKIALLQSLKIVESKEEFKEAVKSITPNRKTPKAHSIKGIKRCRPTEVTPLRKSRRLAKLDVNLSENSLYAKAIADAHEEEKKKEIPSIYSFKEAINDADDYCDFENYFKFYSEEDKKYNSEFVSRFEHMNLKESQIAKVTPVRITSLVVHPTTDKIIVIAGSKYGQLGFWNATSDSNPILFTPHDGGITNLKVIPNYSHKIMSSSYDGTVRCGNVEKKVFNKVYDISEETVCTYFDFVSSSTLLVSQRNGNVSIIDVRSGSLKSEKKHSCSDYAVKTVSVHPVNKNVFLSADSKGCMKLWDLRKLQSKPVITVPHHKRSISSAFFSPVTGNSILTTSLDDTLCIFDSSNVENEILHRRTIRHNNCTGRWLSPFKATWLPSDDAFVVGSMLYPRRIEIFNVNGNNIHNFMDENLNSVTSVNQFHPSLNVLVGANSSGKVFVLMDTKLNF